MNDNKRRIFIREHVRKHLGHLDEIEFEFIDNYQSERSFERKYSLWLTQDHYTQTVLQKYGHRSNRMPSFEEYVHLVRVLIAGHCSGEEELVRVFQMIDQNRNGLIELNEFSRFIFIIGRSTTEEKISDLIECVLFTDDQTLNYEQFKNFVRLGYSRELLISVSM